MKKKLRQSDLTHRKKALKSLELVYLGLFLLLIGWLSYFIVFSSDNLIINSYNPRMAKLESNIVRGQILDRDGEILAETVTLNESESRVYHFENAFSHVLGYSTHGKTGLEAAADLYLLRSNMPITQKIYYELTGQKKLGDNLVTTLDLDLQLKANELLGNRKGAIVAIEPSTGKILCMVSKPDFNPNEVVLEWDGLISDEENSPLLNRAIQGVYPPGSTFKIVTAMAYLAENPGNPFSYECTGTETFEDKVIHCYNNRAHGVETLKEAFAYSCNTGFAVIGETLDILKMRTLAETLMFNRPIPFDLPVSESSFALTEQDSVAKRAETVIGQGDTMITPLHNAMIAAMVANGGMFMEPYVIDRIENNEGKVVKKYIPKVLQEVDGALVTELSGYMEEVVISGTADSLASEPFAIAGKTGSAENPFGDAHGWFIGYAPAQSPQIAIAIVLENSGSSTDTLPITKELMELYIQK